MRGATWGSVSVSGSSDFNPRSSCEERLKVTCRMTSCGLISIHAPHARSDMQAAANKEIKAYISIHAPHARSDVLFRRNSGQPPKKEFQSTLLMRGATRPRQSGRDLRKISIHAPHARSDSFRTGHIDFQHNFNPRSSCEERPGFSLIYINTVIFQSTLLMRGATHE